MIKFFKKIRQDFLSDGKTGNLVYRPGRYLKYAIGEIILVVIGILIALSINNWNETRKEQSKIKAGLIELKSALESDANQLDYLIVRLEVADKAGERLLNTLKQPTDSIDLVQLLIDIYFSQWLVTFGRSSNSYESLVNNGETDLIKDNVLKRELGSYYNTDSWGATYLNGPLIKSYEEYIAYSHNFTQPNALRLAYESYYPTEDSLKIKSLKSLDGPSLINTAQLNNVSTFIVVVDRLQTNRYIQLAVYKQEKDNVEELIKLISIEIELH